MQGLSLKESPRERKAGIIKKLNKDLKISTRKIVELTGISESSVNRYIASEIPKIDENSDYWGLYESIIKKIWKEQDAELVAMATQRIKETLPKAKLYQATGVFKTVRELNQPQNNTNVNVSGEQIAVQVVEGDVAYNQESESNEPK